MDLAFSTQDAEFREEVRAYLRDNLPPELASREARGFHIGRHDIADWHRTLYRRGWAAPKWPENFGGTGWTPIQHYIFEAEYALANAPELSLIGLAMAGPVICRFGSAEMQQTFLEPILSGDMWFCQGFSEPQAGSDLANLRTRAIRDGAEYVISGQKIWTTSAHEAEYMICLARTNADVKPQAGLSLILLPMDAAGVTVRPIETIDGHHHINEVFLDDVRVPVENLIGKPDSGWAQAKFLLNNERTHNAFTGLLKRYVARIPELIDHQVAEGLPKPAAEEYRRTLQRLSIDIDALEWSVLRVLASQESPVLGAAASALKVRGSELMLRAGDLAVAVAGPQIIPEFGSEDVAPFKGGANSIVPGILDHYYTYRAATIYGGSNEIQRTIIWNTMFRG